jgi:transposase
MSAIKEMVRQLEEKTQRIAELEKELAKYREADNIPNRCPYCGTIIAKGEVICGECACEDDGF